MRQRRSSARCGQSGLTLVELLVSMLIMGFVLALVSEAVFQVSQVSRSAQAVTAQLSSRWSSGWAAAPVIANLVAPAEAPVGRCFEGDSIRLNGYTIQPPFGDESGVRAFGFELRSARDASNRSELLVVETDAFGKPASEAVIASFDARAEFAYVDATGQVQLSWPPITVSGNREAQDLPRAVLVRDRGSQQLLGWYGYQGEIFRARPAFNPFGSTQ